jgi:hypothetical protein
MDDPWIPLSQRVGLHVQQDPRLCQELAELSKRSSYEEKITTALEEWRIFGLRQQMFDMHLRQQLNRLCQRPLAQKMW